MRSERSRYRDGGEELYDESKDALEWTNLAATPELASVKRELARHLPAVNTPVPEAGAPRRFRVDP